MMTHKPIKNWAEDDRPREKFALKGAGSLSNSELLAIILGSGNRHMSAVALARHILEHCSHNLTVLSGLSTERLQQFEGVGQAKAIHIAAAFELGRRRQQSEALDLPKISSSADAFQYLRTRMEDLAVEQSWILFMNNNHAVVAVEQLSAGGIASTVIDPRIVFRRALENKACAIILSHNHPSGTLKPSQADHEITRKIKEAGKHIDIQLLDHLIISNKGYFSFADEGVL